MVGLTGAGKTTFLHEMKLGDVEEREPAPGLVLQTVRHKAFKTSVSLTVMDVGGDTTLEPVLFDHLGELPNGLVFVIDCSDIPRFQEARAEFDRMLACDAFGDAPLLVLVSRINTDATDSLSLPQLAADLGLHSITNRRWRIQPCTVTEKGIDKAVFSGLDWLAKVLRAQARVDSPKSTPSQSSPLPPQGGRPRAGTAYSNGTGSSSDTDSTVDPEEVGEECRKTRSEPSGRQEAKVSKLPSCGSIASSRRRSGSWSKQQGKAEVADAPHRGAACS
jgi:hypothetical protein